MTQFLNGRMCNRCKAVEAALFCVTVISAFKFNCATAGFITSCVSRGPRGLGSLI